MRCERCGHALGTNSPVCPNCGAMMTNSQLKERNDWNKDNQFKDKLYEMKSKNSGTHEESSSNKGILILLFIVVLVIGILLVKTLIG